MLQIRDYSQGAEKFIQYVKDTPKLHKCSADDIMLARYGYIGKAFTGLEGAYNVALVKVVKKTEVDTKYLLYYFQSRYFQHFLESNVGSRATISGFNKTELRDARIPTPDHDTQLKISRQLSLVDSVIERHCKELSYCDDLVKSRFVEMFGSGNNPIRRLDEVASIQGGLTKNAKRKSLLLHLPYLRVANVLEGVIDPSEMKTIGLTEAEMKKCLLEPGDVLFVEGNGSVEQIGRVAIWAGEISPCVYQNHLIRARCSPEVLPVFLVHYFMSQEGRRQITARAVSTSGLHSLSAGKIKSLLNYPSLPSPSRRSSPPSPGRADKSRFAIRGLLDRAISFLL